MRRERPSASHLTTRVLEAGQLYAPGDSDDPMRTQILLVVLAVLAASPACNRTTPPTREPAVGGTPVATVGSARDEDEPATRHRNLA